MESWSWRFRGSECRVALDEIFFPMGELELLHCVKGGGESLGYLVSVQDVYDNKICNCSH